MENYGYQVIDLGRDVAPEEIVRAAAADDVKLVGLSALMTTTLKSMEDTITALRKSGHDCKIMVGGAVLTPVTRKKSAPIFMRKMQRNLRTSQKKCWAEIKHSEFLSQNGLRH